LPQLRSDPVRNIGPAEELLAQILAGLRYEGRRPNCTRGKRENIPGGLIAV
jgi:hypothetical protein